MQNIVSATFGDPSGFVYFSTLGVIAMALWIVPLGLFTKGGRGWCLFLCPAGTVMGLASHLSRRLPWGRRVRVDASACGSCGTCAGVCPMRAIDVGTRGTDTPTPEESGSADAPAREIAAPTGPSIDQHLCNECMDCARACPTGVFTYGRPS